MYSEDMVNEVLEVTYELDKIPTRDEFLKHNMLNYNKRHVYNAHGGYRNLLVNAGLKEPPIIGEADVECEHCRIMFTKNNIDIAKTNYNFCSHSCSATYSNIARAKSVPVKQCENCNGDYVNKYRDVTRTCSSLCRMEKNMKNTIMSDKINSSGANTYDKIRHNARCYSKNFYPKYCMNCGYNKHYEVCHVKDIKDFDRDSTVYEINHADNLIHLCPNCHWEFDNQGITLTDIKTLQKTHKL